MTSAQRDENRFSDADRLAILGRLADVTGQWPKEHRSTIDADGLALERTSAYAIGCSIDDLRDSELAELRGYVSGAISAHNDRRTAGR